MSKNKTKQNKTKTRQFSNHESRLLSRSQCNHYIRFDPIPVKVRKRSLTLHGIKSLKMVFSTDVVCIKTQQKHCSIKHHVKPNNSISSSQIWYNHRPSFLFKSTIIPIQLTCRACFNAHMKYHTLNSCERFGHASLYKYWLLMREIVQNNSPRWLETVGYYISRDEVEGNIGTRSPVNEGSYFAQFPN